nr:hypothetical protein [Acidimicrobiia bacterium]
MTSRAMLQEKSLDELRVIAASLGVPDHATLQKSKLITAIVGSDGFEASSEPVQIELPAIEEVRSADGEGGAPSEASPRGEDEAEGEGAEAPEGEESGEDRWEGGSRNKRRRRRGGGGGGDPRREPY